MMAKTPVPDRRPWTQSLAEIRKDKAAAQAELDAAKEDLARIERENPEATARVNKMIVDAALSGPGFPVTVRLQRNLFERLEAYRGGKTRPQAIRELLEEHLP